jgi:hypothetical protein
MGQTDVASLLYAMRMHYPSPQWLVKVDGLHPHLAQQMANGEFRNSKAGWFFTLRRHGSVPAKDR